MARERLPRFCALMRLRLASSAPLVQRGAAAALATTAFAAAGGAAPLLPDVRLGDVTSARASTSLRATQRAPIPPAAPRNYRLPRTRVFVRTSQGLVNALARAAPANIVLADGDFTTVGTTSPTPYFQAGAGHRLYARNRGRAVLRAGLEFGGNYGPGGGEVHGLVFDIAEDAKTSHSSAITTWGVRGRNTKIYDTRFNGHGGVGSAILAWEPSGLIVTRVVIRRFRNFGIYASDNDESSRAVIGAITDVRVSGIKHSSPGSSNGTEEAGVLVGHRVARPVSRLWVRDTGWMGLETLNKTEDTTFTDLNIDHIEGVDPASGKATGTGIYIERFTKRSLFRRFLLGPDIKYGVISEWDEGIAGNQAGTDNTIANGVIDTRKSGVPKRVGVFVDYGTLRMTIRRVVFRGASYACIVDLGRSTVIQGNDYRRRVPGAATVAREHP